MSSSGQTGSTSSWLRRLANSITGEPRDLDELATILVEARERGLIDADVLQMLESVLEVSEIQVRDIMVPRSQMVVINRDDTADRILPIDAAVADRWGALNVPDPVPTVDGLLAATALVHDLVLVTRNVRDVAGTGVRLLDPTA